MTWIQQIVTQTCKKFGICNQPEFDGIKKGSFRIRIIEDDPHFTIKIFDLDCNIAPQKIENIYWDQVESSLEDAIRSIH